MAPAQSDFGGSMTMPRSPPPPPSDLSTYSRSMLQHTKRLLEATSGQPHRRSQGGGAAPPPPSLPNGGSSRSRTSSEYSSRSQDS